MNLLSFTPKKLMKMGSNSSSSSSSSSSSRKRKVMRREGREVFVLGSESHDHNSRADKSRRSKDPYEWGLLKKSHSQLFRMLIKKTMFWMLVEGAKLHCIRVY